VNQARPKPFCISKHDVVEAWKRVKANQGAAGVDEESLRDFERKLKDNLYRVWNRMSSGSYLPPPVRTVSIPKSGGGERKLGIPTVADRVAQMVVKMNLEPRIEPLFHNDSYGYRPFRSAHDAVGRARQRCWQYDWVLDLDIKGFFDNLPHQVILQAVRDHVADGKVLDLLERFLRCGVLEDGRLLATTKGTPQGGVVSPSLANIVLNRLDWHLDQLGLRFVRYADDFVVLCQNRSQAEEARSQVETLLAQLGLSLSPQKTAITSYGKGYTFLGFILSSRSRRIRPKSLEMFKDKVRAITVRKHNLDLEMVDHLNALIRGVAQYFCASFATNREQFHKLDSWIRMRLRASKFKRKNTLDNYKLRIRTFQQTYRLLDLETFYAATHASVHRSPSRGTSSRSRPATETVTPVNLWN